MDDVLNKTGHEAIAIEIRTCSSCEQSYPSYKQLVDHGMCPVCAEDERWVALMVTVNQRIDEHRHARDNAEVGTKDRMVKAAKWAEASDILAIIGAVRTMVS